MTTAQSIEEHVCRLSAGWTLTPIRTDFGGYWMMPPPMSPEEGYRLSYEDVEAVATDYRVCPVPSLSSHGNGEWMPAYQGVRLRATGTKCSACGDERNTLYPSDSELADIRCKACRAYGTLGELWPADDSEPRETVSA